MMKRSVQAFQRKNFVNQPTVAQTSASRAGCLAQLLWFVFVGWWLGLIWTSVAWFLLNTYIGIPVGVAMLNYVPQIIALRGQRVVEVYSGRTVEPVQINLILRAVYFFAIGWWLSGIWLTIAYLACATIILMPVGFKMFDMTPMVVSLRQ
jgi:uncharacterized membrane protein YccF (DUF307 family)